MMPLVRKDAGDYLDGERLIEVLLSLI